MILRKNSLASMVLAMASILTMSGSTWGWSLSGGGVTWTIEESHGALDQGMYGGNTIISGCRDQYRVVYASSQTNSSENADTIGSTDTSGLPSRLVVTCTNATLGATLIKTYQIDSVTGWLNKTVSVTKSGSAGYFVVWTQVKPGSTLWNSGVLHHPTWHSATPVLLNTAAVGSVVSMGCTGGTGMMCLYNAGLGVTFGQYRRAGNGTDVFLDYYASSLGGTDAQTTVYPGSPGYWQMPVMSAPVGGTQSQARSVTIGYGVKTGTFVDYHKTYQAIPAVAGLLSETPADSGSPAWTKQVLIDEQFSYQDVGDRASSWGPYLLVYKFPAHYGMIQAVGWSYYDDYMYSYPSLDEQVDPAISPLLPPSAIKSDLDSLRDACPTGRMKVGIYTHCRGISIGTALQDYLNNPTWWMRDASNNPIRHAIDQYPSPTAGGDLQTEMPAVQNYFLSEFSGLRTNLGADFVYIDGTPDAGGPVDWGHHPVQRENETQYNYYRQFVTAAHGSGAAILQNYPVSLLGDAGYFDMPWYSFYTADWRNLALRLLVARLYNPDNFSLSMPGQSLAQDHPGWASDGQHVQTNYMTLFGLTYSLYGGYNSNAKNALLQYGAPWIRQAYEIRHRSLAEANLTPNWVADLSEAVEGYSWRDDSSQFGLVTLLNHGSTATRSLAFDMAPLGITLGNRVWVWRLEMPDQRYVDYSSDTFVSPVRRLAAQNLLSDVPSAPSRMTQAVNLTSENAVAVMVTASPALISKINDESTQFWLPECLGAGASGTVNETAGEILATVNPGNYSSVEVAVVLPSPAFDNSVITQRRALGSPYWLTVGNQVVTEGGTRFVKLAVNGPGITELRITTGVASLGKLLRMDTYRNVGFTGDWWIYQRLYNVDMAGNFSGGILQDTAHGGGLWKEPAIGDVDNDGGLELVVFYNYESPSGNDYSWGHMWDIAPDGTLSNYHQLSDFGSGGWYMDDRTIECAIGDYDNDGVNELVLAHNWGGYYGYNQGARIYTWQLNATGHVVPGTFTELADWAGDGRNYSLGIGDVDGDGLNEMAVYYNYMNYNSSTGHVSPQNWAWLWRYQGGTRTLSLDLGWSNDWLANVDVGDIDSDGVKELVIMRNYLASENGGTDLAWQWVYEWTGTGFGNAVNLDGGSWLQERTCTAAVLSQPIPGDVNGDGRVNGSDLSIVLGALDSSSESGNWDARADLDKDGEVSSTDLSIVLANME